MKKILITGGAGFIGSHLCERLLSEGNSIICLDNFYTGSKKNIQHLLDNKNFQLVEGDIINPVDFEVDEIYNLACPASPIHYQADRVKTAKTSVLGILNVLDAARKYNAKILQASTSEVYGDPKVHPQKETYWGNVNPVGIRSCYDEGKRMAETFVSDYAAQYGINARIVRIFNTYGPNMHPKDGRVVSNFIIQALKNEDITVYGNGAQTRSFCYVDDLIEGIIKMMNNPQNFRGPVNLGNTAEYTILEFAKLIIDLTGSNSKIIFKDLPQDDPAQRRPDLELAKKELNWEPEIDIKEGILKTTEYFRGRLNL